MQLINAWRFMVYFYPTNKFGLCNTAQQLVLKIFISLFVSNHLQSMPIFYVYLPIYRPLIVL